MAIKSTTLLRRLARTRSWIAMIVLCLCRLAMAQQVTVTSGSVVPFPHTGTWNDISHILVSHANGTVLFMDWANQGTIYQLTPGATAPTVAVSQVLQNSSNSWWSYGMAIDSHDNIFVADSYNDNGQQLYCVPYNSTTGTWDWDNFSSYGWGGNVGGGSIEPWDLAVDDDDNLIISTQSAKIYSVPLIESSSTSTCPTYGTATIMAKGLKARAVISVDHAGTVYLIEDPTTTTRSGVVEGIYEVPKGSQLVGAGDGTLEPTLTRVDPAGKGFNFVSVHVDNAGNLYLSSSTGNPDGIINGVLKVPNEGTPTAPSLVWNDAVLVSPVASNGASNIDARRGVMWIASGNPGWTPSNSSLIAGTEGVVEWLPGGANLASSTAGTAGSASAIFFTFNKAVNLGGVAPAQIGSSVDFVSATYPYAGTSGTGSSATTTYYQACDTKTAFKSWTAVADDSTSIYSCAYSLALDSALPGGVAGEVQMTDTSSNILSGSTTFVNGVGVGAAAAVYSPAAEVTISSGLTSPKQVAGDAAGNSYVADSATGKIVEYPAGSSSVAGTAIISGLSAPTGVAVDGAGNVYVADSGSVYGYPYLNGALQTASKSTLATGLGNKLNLTVDGVGNLYVADTDNARVVKIANTTMSTMLVDASTVTVGSGYTTPSAVAVDGAGNLYVADGANLYEVNAAGTQSSITSALAGSVTGVAADASGSLYVAETGGILRIPTVSGVLSINDATFLAQDLAAAPLGVALDRQGNLYVTSTSNGAGIVSQVGVNGTANFGQVSPGVTSDSLNLQVFNIGNAALNFNTAPSLAGTNADEYAFVTASDNSCDDTGVTSVAVGGFCNYALTLTANDVGERTATATIPSTALNAPSLSVALEGDGVGNLTKSQMQITLTPSGTLSYPATVTLTATVSSQVDGDTNVPTGKATLLLNGTAYGTAQSLSNGSVSFALSNLNGGSYTAKISYKGDTVFSGSSATQSFTVNKVTPAVTTSTPDTYVKYGVQYAIKVSVTSTVGTPTGTVSILENGAVADSTQSAITLDGSGSATFYTTNLALGSHTLTAVYNGDTNYAKTSAASITFDDVNPSVLITTPSTTVSVTPGVAATATLTLSSVVGYSSNAVSISCDTSTLPKYSECTFDNPTPSVTSTSSTVVLTLSTNVPVNIAAGKKSNAEAMGYSLAAFFGLGLIGLWRMRRKSMQAGWLGALVLMLVLPLALAGMTACNNSGYTKTPASPTVTTPSGTYTISVITQNQQTLAQTSLPFTMTVTVK